jgi:hypothetical protein
MGRLGKVQPNPDGSPCRQAVKSVFDDLGSLKVNASDLVKQRSQGLELSEAGDLGVL